jgi:SAM-dependent methyltransferase
MTAGGYWLNVRMATERCDACGDPLRSVRYPGVDLDLRRCGRCDLVFNAARDEMQHEELGFDDAFFARYGEHPLMFQTELDRILGLLGRASPTGITAVDFGCGAGQFLRFLAGRGVNAIGVELDERLCTRLRQSGLRCYLHVAAAADDMPGGADVVYMSHTLEHLMRPLEDLRAAFRLVRPGGGLITTVPCSSPATRALDRLRARWRPDFGWGLFYGGHLTYFNQRGLAALVRAAGFEEVAFLPGVLGENLLRGLLRPELVEPVYRRVLLPTQRLFALVGFMPNLCAVARRPAS